MAVNENTVEEKMLLVCGYFGYDLYLASVTNSRFVSDDDV